MDNNPSENAEEVFAKLEAAGTSSVLFGIH